MPRRMSAKNRERVMELLRADPDALGPQLGLMSMKYNIPAAAYATLLDASVPTIYSWFYGTVSPHERVTKQTKRLLIVMRRALLAHEFPLEGTHEERVQAMFEVVRRHVSQ